MTKSGDQHSSADLRLGQTVDHYSLLSVLGTGSTSTVYLAQRLDDPRALVAVKVLSYHAAAQPSDRASFRMRFLREARAAGKLRNECILPVLSFGESDELTYMVMPVIVGGTLAVRLAQQQGPLPLHEIADYLKQLAVALDYVHQQGLVHRDVKPSNILLDEHGHVYLTDFGIARLFDSGDNALTREGPLTLTRTGQVLGTPYYMAPEQIKGEPVSPATDIYAVGVVSYQLVTGQVPFHGDTPLAVALQHLQETPVSPKVLREELPEPVADVILRALAKDPAARYPSVSALAEAFSEALAAMEQPVAPSSVWPFATTYGLQAVVQAAAPDELDPRLAGIYDELIGTKLGAYRVEHLRDADEHGAVFVARREGANTPCRLRVLVSPPDLGEEEQAAFQGEAAQRLQSLAALEHPHIEQIVDSGTHLGMPYVVARAVSGKSLSDLLAANGPMEPQVIGRYLYQIADALEYAHAHGALHLNLTAARIIARGDDDLILTDFALQPPRSQPTHDAAFSPLYLDGEAGAPEQLLGQPVGAYTDVYALGGTLYQMFTAHQVFDGKTRDDIAQQHLHSTIPPARTWRTGLPTGIENVLARAMAKEPEYRFAFPRELADAYRKVLARADGSLSARAALLGTAARAQIVRAAETPVLSSANLRPPAQASLAAPRGPDAPATGARLTATAASGLTRRRIEAQSAPPSGSSSGMPARRAPVARRAALPLLKSRLGTEIISVAALVAILAGSFALFNAFRPKASTHAAAPTATVVGPTGEVRFFDGTNGAGGTDALSISISTASLAAPPKGSAYEVWLVDDQGEHFMAVGSLTSTDQGWTLSYAGSGGAAGAGTNLLGFGDKVEVTLEQSVGSAPAGKALLVGTFPSAAFIHIRHLLVAFPATPGQRGFLVGLLQQATVLNEQSQVLLSFIQRQYFVSAACAAQSVVDIVEGAGGSHYQPLSPDCAARNITQMGDGYGLLGNNGYLAGVSDHASLAANAPDANSLLRLHSQHVIIAVTNVTGWLTTLDQDAVSVLAGNHDPAKAQEIATLADHALHGVDTNGDESIDPVVGEAGVVTAYDHGQLLAELDLALAPSK